MNRVKAATSRHVGEAVTVKQVLVWASLATIFVSGLYVPTPIGILFWGYLLMSGTFVLMMVVNRSAGFRKDWLFFVSLLLFFSLISIVLTNISYGEGLERALSSTAKIMFLFFFLVFYSLIYKSSGNSVLELFHRYLQVATFFAWLGVAQEAIFVVSRVDIILPLGSGAKNYGSYLGVAGLSVEPAFYACALLPAAAYHASEFVRGFRMSMSGVVVILAIAFSTSSLGYLGLIVSVILSLMTGVSSKRLWIVFTTVPLALAVTYTLTSTAFFQLRWNDTVSVLKGGELTLDGGMNISTYSAAVNATIAMRSMMDNYGVGSGFGTYSSVFDKYIVQYEMPSYRDTLPGRGSATSLFSRATAELGIVAWAFLLLVGYWCRRVIRSDAFTSIGIAYISTLSIILLRMGEYYANGVILVFLMIYWMKKEIDSRSKANSRAAG